MPWKTIPKEGDVEIKTKWSWKRIRLPYGTPESERYTYGWGWYTQVYVFRGGQWVPEGKPYKRIMEDY